MENAMEDNVDINSEFDLVQKFYENDLKRFILPSKLGYSCFDGQKENEKALLYIRKHWVIELAIVLGAALWLILPFGALFILIAYRPDLMDSVYFRLLIIFVHLFELFMMLNWYVKWIDHHLDIIIITNRRIVDVNQRKIFNRTISSTSLKQIQDVSGRVVGVIPSLLNFGTINVETAGAGQLRGLMESMMRHNQKDHALHPESIGQTGNVFEMPYVYNAMRVATAILNIRDFYIQREKEVAASKAYAQQQNAQVPPQSVSPPENSGPQTPSNT